MIDLLIAGAGPAGLATALYAARSGLDVTVVDPRVGPLADVGDPRIPAQPSFSVADANSVDGDHLVAGSHSVSNRYPMLGAHSAAGIDLGHRVDPGTPIDKACGEGLMPGAVAALRSLGIDPPGRPFRGIGYFSGTHSAEALFRSGPGLGTRRTELHAAMMSAVLAAGIRVVPRAVGEVLQDDASVSAAGLSARYLVAADGLHSPISRSMSLDVPARGTHRWGLRRHFAVAPWSELVQVHWSDRAEAYVTPVGPELVGVAVLSSERLPFDVQLARFPYLQERLSGIGGGSVRGAGPLRRRTRRRVSGRVLLVGDAAGYVDALTGEGIAVSLACARSLVTSVTAGHPDAYEAGWLRESRRYRAITSTLLMASDRPMLRGAIVPAAERVPWAFRAIVGQLAR